jgi:hypothetical protein
VTRTTRSRGDRNPGNELKANIRHEIALEERRISLVPEAAISYDAQGTVDVLTGQRSGSGVPIGGHQ